MTFRTSCIHCNTLLEPGTGYWHLYGCRERARRVLAGLAPPLDLEHEHGVLSVRVRPARRRDDPGWTCPDCGSRYVGHREPYLPHQQRCSQRGFRVTLRNLARMYWLRLRGRGCASYIREQERKHLRHLLRR